MKSHMMIEESEWDLDEQQVEQEQSEIPEEFYEHFQNCAVILAQHWLDVFFAERQWAVGGPIPKSMLHAPEIVSMVLNTTQVAGIDTAYDLLQQQDQEVTQFPEVTNHMVYVLNFVRQCSDMRVPPCFRGGLLLVLLHFCQGISLHVGR